MSRPQRPMTPSSSHWLFSLQVFLPKEYCQFIRKYIQEAIHSVHSFSCQVSKLHSIHLGNHLLFNTVWIHQELYFILKHGKFIQPTSISILASCINSQNNQYSLKDQYRSVFSLKNSSSQLFTYTGYPFHPWGVFPQLINIF